MTSLTWRSISVFFILVLAGASQGQCQMISPMLYEGPRISLEDHAQSGASEPSATSSVSLDYRPGGARRRQNLAHFVEMSRRVNPEAAEQLAQIFASRDIIEQIREPIGKVGLRIDNVADAYALWWIDAWQASHGIDEKVDRSTAMSVKRQVERAFAQSGGLRGASNVDKQRMAEALLIQALLIEACMEQAKADPAGARRLADAVTRGAQQMNLDLAKMTLTDKGFLFAP
jgi:hypothetical protein